MFCPLRVCPGSPHHLCSPATFSFAPEPTPQGFCLSSSSYLLRYILRSQVPFQPALTSPPSEFPPAGGAPGHHQLPYTGGPLRAKPGASLRAPPSKAGALTMFPANVPNYPPFGPTPVVETFQPEEASCFGKFLGSHPRPPARFPRSLITGC